MNGPNSSYRGLSAETREENMKRLATVCAVLCAMWAFCQVATAAFESDFDDLRQVDRNLRGWKLGRGFTNILLGPHEFVTHLSNNAIKGASVGAYQNGFTGYFAGSTTGFIAGIGPGIYYAAKRMSLGVLEVLTFWKPEYGPTMDPAFGTRSYKWGFRDYYDPEPFWYPGPEK